jgi:ABC-2 type transport system permease protein
VPGWIQTIGDLNPVNWAVEAGRSAAMGDMDWGLITSRIGLLLALVVVSATFATRAFGTYQRSL